MTGLKEKTVYSIILVITIIFFIASGCGKKKSSEEADSSSVQMQQTETESMTAQKQPEMSEPAGQPETSQMTDTQDEMTDKVPQPSDANVIGMTQKPKASAMSPALQKLMSELAYRNFVGQAYYGSNIADVNLTDIEGNTHKITDYEGKNIIVFSFASWCPGCNAQIEFFEMLPEMYDQDKYIILGIAAKTSMDNIDSLKQHIEEKQISFPVIYLEPDSTPAPFNMNRFIPCSYFIYADGTLKIAIEEIVRPKDLIQIMETP